MADLIDLVLHVDVYLLDLVKTYGAWIYGVLFAIVFAETGLVVTPFLPGDSLLFAAGALAASGALDVRLLLVLLVAAAVAGDAVNYSIGRAVGARVIRRAEIDPRWRRWINPAHIAQGARVLRAPWRQGDRPRPLHADRPDVRPVRRRRGRDDVPVVCVLQRHRRRRLGRSSAWARGTSSATCRSSRRTSRSSRSASSRSRSCRWSSNTSGTGDRPARRRNAFSIGKKSQPAFASSSLRGCKFSTRRGIQPSARSDPGHRPPLPG